MREIENPLIVRVTVDRAHESVCDRECVIQHFRHGRETVCCATGVGHDFVLLGIEHVVIHADANRDVRIFRRRADQHALGSGLQVQLGLIPASEQAGRFKHHIDVQFFPREIRWIAIL